MSHDPALTAAHDQDLAEVRDLTDLVHRHRRRCADPQCPSMAGVAALTMLPPGRWLHLLVAALMRIDDLQTGITGAIDAITPPAPLDHPWHP